MIDGPALEAANAPLNAFVDWDRLAVAATGPLQGVTIGVKSNIAVKGLPWTAGTELFRHRIAERDADVVAKLRDAGAVILGTLNMEEAALGSKTDNPWFGPTQNPHRIGHTAGGSSGGSGAAVAAGLCDAALGSDTMGSVRIPAAHCGVYGFKPATMRVSQDGLEPADLRLDAIGPLARDLDMLERVARVVSEFGEGEIAGAGAKLSNHGVPVRPEVESAFDRALAVLPVQPETAQMPHPQSRIRFAGFVHVARAMDAHLSKADPAKLSDHLRHLISYGPRRSEADWAEDQRILTESASVVRALVTAHGFLIMPTTPNPPFPHSEAEPAEQADFTCLANIAGLPALSLPMGWTADGLPLGVQIVGAPGAEAGLFGLARKLDAGLAAYRAPASLSV